MVMLQLNPPIPVETPDGSGLAHALIDYGIEWQLLWVVFRDRDGVCWTYNNAQIRGVKNGTLGRNELLAFKKNPVR